MRQKYLCIYFLAFIAGLFAIHALPAPKSTAIATINPDHELVERFDAAYWAGATARVFAYNAEVYLKAGACIGLGCYQAGNVDKAQGVGIATGIIYAIAAVGNSFLPKDYRPGGDRRRGGDDEWEKFLGLTEDAGLMQDLPNLIDFSHRNRDQITFHTKHANLEVTRLQVMHPVKRSMESVIRLRTRPQTGLKRQEGYYGIEAFVTEESDYGYPPDRGWVGDLANDVGNAISDFQTEGNFCMKMVNFDGATSYSYLRYDGTPDNEEYDNVFGCEQANYD